MAAPVSDPIAAVVFDHLKKVGTATLASQLRKKGLRNVFIEGARPLSARARHVVGIAYTLRFIPMREDLSSTDILSDPDYPPRRAIEDIPPGHVLVVDCRGDQRAGVIGDILALRLQMRGVAGVVSDGPMRDVAQLTDMDFPIFCSGGASPATLSAHFGADLQCPIACGGVAVLPGDIIAGDEDGVLVVPRTLAAEVARDAVAQEELEVFLKLQIAAGRPTRGVYPADAATQAAYEEWRKQK